MKHLLIAAVAAAAFIPAAAQAQDAGSGMYAGIQGGYHDFKGGANSPLVGGYLGFNMPVGEALVVGAEGNANLAIEGDTDAEYGVSAHLGFRTGNGMIFGRVGWQEIEFDGPGSDGDMLYGIGGEFGLGTNTAFRVTLDTLDFDSTRIAAGITFHF